jgi:hypothetical protein
VGLFRSVMGSFSLTLLKLIDIEKKTLIYNAKIHTVTERASVS